jgi:hypothetical protein
MRALDARREFESYMVNSQLNHNIKESHINTILRKMPHNHLLDLFLMIMLIERENEYADDISDIFTFESNSNIKAMNFYNKLDKFTNQDVIN